MVRALNIFIRSNPTNLEVPSINAALRDPDPRPIAGHYSRMAAKLGWGHAMPLAEDQVAKLMDPELVGLNPPVPPNIVPAEMRVHFFADAVCLLGTVRAKTTRSKTMRGEFKSSVFPHHGSGARVVL